MCADVVLCFTSRQTFRCLSGKPVQSFQFFFMSSWKNYKSKTKSKTTTETSIQKNDNSDAQMNNTIRACQAIA